jgi:hypothetical protein
MIWVVGIEASSPDDQSGQDLRQSLRLCIKILGTERTSSVCDNDGWAISIAVDAEDLREAIAWAMRHLFSAASESGLPLWPIVALSAIDGDYAATGKQTQRIAWHS